MLYSCVIRSRVHLINQYWLCWYHTIHYQTVPNRTVPYYPPPSPDLLSAFFFLSRPDRRLSLFSSHFRRPLWLHSLCFFFFFISISLPLLFLFSLFFLSFLFFPFFSSYPLFSSSIPSSISSVSISSLSHPHIFRFFSFNFPFFFLLLVWSGHPYFSVLRGVCAFFPGGSIHIVSLSVSLFGIYGQSTILRGFSIALLTVSKNNPPLLPHLSTYLRSSI